LDFITPLPECVHEGRKYRHILVVVDRLGKRKRFIALETLEVQHVVERFLEWVWREEGYPKTIVSDRGSQFVSYFWRRLCQRIGTTPKLSSAYHPETDGQTERANGLLKTYLRAYVNFHQNDWVRFLPIAEFEANASKSTSTGISPFEATKGYMPRNGTDPPMPWENVTRTEKLEGQAVDKMIERVTEIRETLKYQLAWAQAVQKEYADRKRVPAPEIKVGDWVMLDAKNVSTNRPSDKLDYKNLGRFKVSEVAKNESAVKLDLPESFKIFPWFHPALIHLASPPALTT